MIPDDRLDQHLPRSQPPQEERFKSAITQVEREYLKFRDSILPIEERTDAGHRFMKLGASLLPDEETEFKEAVSKYLDGYRAPRVRWDTILTSDHIIVNLLHTGGGTEDTHTVLPSQMPEAIKILRRQQYEDYYSRKLIDAVGDVMTKLVKHKVLLREPEKTSIDFGFLGDEYSNTEDVGDFDDTGDDQDNEKA